MKRVRKKRKTHGDFLKLSGLIKENTCDMTKFDLFQEKLDDFCEKFEIFNVKLVFIPFTIKVIVENRVDWSKRNHELLCKYFGCKLVRYNLTMEADKFVVTWTYVADCDDVPVLDFDNIMLGV